MKSAGGETFRPNDYAPQLRALESAALEHFLEGGQAVNAWAEIYSAACPGLAELAPFTSRDCDVWLGPEAFRKIASILSGKLIKATPRQTGSSAS